MHANLWKFYLFIGLFAWCILLPILYVLRLTMLALLSAATLVIASLRRQPMEFTQAMRLSAMAYTPVAVIDIAVLMVRVETLPHWALFGMGWSCSSPSSR